MARKNIKAPNSQSSTSQAPAAATSQHHDGLSEWRERQRHIKEARVEQGRRLQEKLQDMRAKGLLNNKKPQTMSQVSGLGKI